MSEEALEYARKVEEEAGFDRAEEREALGSELMVGERVYWGVWHRKGGWLLDTAGMLFYTDSPDVALAQMQVSRSLDAAHRQGLDPKLWEVRQIGGQDDSGGAGARG